ncbi:MAG: hypothetical protein AABY22_31415, partial [Nanoarchaeota archaeon]
YNAIIYDCDLKNEDVNINNKRYLTDQISIYIIELNLKTKLSFFPGSYRKFLLNKKISKHITLDNNTTYYCEINII